MMGSFDAGNLAGVRDDRGLSHAATTRHPRDVLNKSATPAG
jgi:hypothetical protein